MREPRVVTTLGWVPESRWDSGSDDCIILVCLVKLASIGLLLLWSSITVSSMMLAVRMEAVLLLAALMVGCADQVAEVDAPPHQVRSGLDRGKIPASAAQPETDEGQSVQKGEITEVDLNRVLQLQDDDKILLVDVRPMLFYGLGHMPGAVSMPRKSFPLSLIKRQAEIDAAVEAGKVVVLYCTNVDCPDGYSVGEEMAEMGYAISIYKGGWEEWRQAGF